MGVPRIEINGDRSRWVILLAEQSDRSFFGASKHEQERKREREKSMRNWETMNEMFAQNSTFFFEHVKKKRTKRSMKSE